MLVSRSWLVIIAALFFTILIPSIVVGQGSLLSDHRYDSITNIRQRAALDSLDKVDTVSASPFWPNIKPALFFSNVRRNIMFPTRVNQGASTNFCGYAAVTHLILKYHPDIYLNYTLSLYRTGQASLYKKTLKPSERVRKAAGTLKNKGELDMRHADQMWFLTLADQFKGYINIFDHRYNHGDENKIWAGTNYGKFNRMIRDFTRDPLTCAGSDLLRPFKNDFTEYINGQLKDGVVLLYVNSKFLYPHKFSLITLRVPSHFIVLYDMNKVEDLTEIIYLDYGMKTEQQITRKRLRKLIFGITTINAISGEKN